MTTITHGPLVQAPPAVVPSRRSAPKLEIVPGKSPRRTAEKWFLGLMVTAMCLFTVALLTFVLRPAATTAVSSSTSSWNQDGP